MSNNGDMVWMDLSVDDAKNVQSFYQQVVGWKSESVSMGEYDDFSMNSSATGEAVTGICHAKGVNADLPPVWLPYFLVSDVDEAVKQVVDCGGELVTPVKSMGSSDRYVVIKDPAGAACALYEKN